MCTEKIESPQRGKIYVFAPTRNRGEVRNADITYVVDLFVKHSNKNDPLFAILASPIAEQTMGPLPNMVITHVCAAGLSAEEAEIDHPDRTPVGLLREEERVLRCLR